MIEKIFQSDKNFSSALDQACIEIVKSPDSKSYKSPELVRLSYSTCRLSCEMNLWTVGSEFGNSVQ